MLNGFEECGLSFSLLLKSKMFLYSRNLLNRVQLEATQCRKLYLA